MPWTGKNADATRGGWLSGVLGRLPAAWAARPGRLPPEPATAADLDHAAEVTGLAVLAVGEHAEILRHNAAAGRLAAPFGGLAPMWSAVVAREAAPAPVPCPGCGAPVVLGAAVVPVSAGGRRHDLHVQWTGHDHRVGNVAGATIVTLAEVTERVAAEATVVAAHRQLQEAEAELRAALDAVPEAVVAAVGDRVVYQNAAAARTFTEPDSAWFSALRRGAGSTAATLVPGPDGEAVAVEVAAPVPLTLAGEPAELFVARDVSQRLRMEAQLRSAERMVALGGLAAGLAHEINNPLTYVIGNLELAQEGVGDVPGRISRALGGAVRVRQVVQQLRAMANPAVVELVSVDLAAALDSTLALALGVGLPASAVERDIPAGLRVQANGVWLGQILLNLVTNALLAMREVVPGARNLRVEAIAAGGVVRLSVTDQGKGVPPEVRARLFEPFVSSRLKGEGTGLGLYLCRELASRMGGRLELARTGPTGSTFELWIPEGEERVAAAPVVLPPARTVSTPARSGRILVIDDEPVVAEVMEGFLRGHAVTVVGDAASARAALGDPGWDVVILDIVLGHDSGIELWRELHAAGSPLAERVIFVTGGSMTPDIARFLMETAQPTLVKPFDFRELAAVVGTTLAAGEADRAS